METGLLPPSRDMLIKLETKYRDIADGNISPNMTVPFTRVRLETKYRDIADGNTTPMMLATGPP